MVSLKASTRYDTVLDEELPALREACKEAYPATAIKDGKPKISTYADVRWLLASYSSFPPNTAVWMMVACKLW
jgi:hypothetical protein